MGVATELGYMASFRSSRCPVSKAILAQFGVGTDVEGITDVDGLQETETSRISRQSPHEGGKISPTHWPSLPPKEICNFC